MLFWFLQAAKVKGCESVAEWSEPIRNHFWHIAEHCNGDAEVLKVINIHLNFELCGIGVYVHTSL
jgi:hypothetical protein